MPDKSIFTYLPTVLNGWKEGFGSLLNPNRQFTNSNVLSKGTDNNVSFLNATILVEGATRAIYNLKNNNAVGHDEIPAEVVKCPRILAWCSTK